MSKKEYGSNFHLECRPEYFTTTDNNFLPQEHTSYFLSGRAALYHLIKQGVTSNKWKRIYFPSYYCHEVVTPIQKLEITIEYYDYNPFTNTSNLEDIIDNESSVFINVNYFNLIKVDDTRFSQLVKIDDLTYDYKGKEQSQADYCFGSLRKEIPISVGGFCSSPKKLELPYSESTTAGVTAHRDRLLAMSLKSRYLSYGIGEKDVFLKLFTASEEVLDNEQTLCGMPQETKNIFKNININLILKHKNRNIKTALKKLEHKDNVMVNLNLKENGFGLIFYFDHPEERDKTRSFLIKNRVYPAILWPNQPTEFAQHIENRVLFVHVDYRYDDSDISTIVNLLNQ